MGQKWVEVGVPGLPSSSETDLGMKVGDLAVYSGGDTGEGVKAGRGGKAAKGGTLSTSSWGFIPKGTLGASELWATAVPLKGGCGAPGHLQRELSKKLV